MSSIKNIVKISLPQRVMEVGTANQDCPSVLDPGQIYTQISQKRLTDYRRIMAYGANDFLLQLSCFFKFWYHSDIAHRTSTPLFYFCFLFASHTGVTAVWQPILQQSVSFSWRCSHILKEVKQQHSLTFPLNSSNDIEFQELLCYIKLNMICQ